MIFTYMQESNKQNKLNIYNQLETAINRTGGYQRSGGRGWWCRRETGEGIKKHRPPFAKINELQV